MVTRGSISKGSLSIEHCLLFHVFMKNSRGICVHRVQTVLATVMPIEPREGPDLRTTLLKYNQYYPRIVAVNVGQALFDIFPLKIEQKCELRRKSLYTWVTT